MAFEPLHNRTVEDGLHVLFQYADDVSLGSFVPALLFVMYAVIALGVYNAQRQSIGRGDMPQAMSAAGFVTTIVAGFLAVIDIVSPSTLGFIIVISVLSVLWLMTSRDS